MSLLIDEVEDNPVTHVKTLSASGKLPWDDYNNHFKIIKILRDEIIYQTFEVKCVHCPSTKTRTADTRSK